MTEVGRLVIESGEVAAVMRADAPELLSTNGMFGFGPISARVREPATGAYHGDGLSIDSDVTHGRNWVSYLCAVSLDDRPAAEFTLRFLAQDDRLTVTCEFAEEHQGFELMGVNVPLVSASVPGGSLALPVRGGRLVDIERSEPHQHVQRATCSDLPLVAMIRQDEAAALLEAGSLDDNIISSVFVRDGVKHAGLAVGFTHRYGPRNPELPSFRVTNRSDAFLTFFRPSGKHWWVDGAKMLRAKVNTSIPPLYDGAVIYKIKLDQPDFDETQFQTFDDAVDRIRCIHNLTAGAKQIAYLNGWQHHGHDTGYPDVFTVNERLGGLEKFHAAIEAGPEYNAVVSFHDNYDDAYTDSPAWEDEIIATDENGVHKAGGVWGGGQAYIIAPHKYIDRARKRIRRTVDMYGVSKTIHVDVFSVVPDRYDFDPANPAGFAHSAEAKNYIIRAFRELGLDMTSEGICAPFVGNVSYGWHFPDSDDAVFSAEEQVPVLPFIYHGRTIGAGGVNSDRHLLKHLLWGLPFCMDIRKSTDLGDFIDLYYLLHVPFFQLASRTMRSYESDGPRHTVHYDGDTCVTIDYDANSYEVVVDGATVAKDYTVTCPMPQGGWVIYSRHGGRAGLSLPDGISSVGVRILSEEEPAETPGYSFEDGALTLDAEPREPYHITEGRRDDSCETRTSPRRGKRSDLRSD